MGRGLGLGSVGAGSGEAADWVRGGGEGPAGGGATCGEGVLKLLSTSVPMTQVIKESQLEKRHKLFKFLTDLQL